MSELAFNVNGEPFEVPAAATGWRVRRLKQKGAPEVVYGRDGLPLVLPIDAELEDLRREVGSPGRYRMDPVDDTCKPISGASAGYVFIHANDRATDTAATSALPAASDSIVIEAMRMNAEMARSVIDRFPQMMEAAAVLLRAADGAGLPARPGMALDDDELEDTEPTAPASRFDLNTVIAQVIPLLMTGLSGKTPKLAEVLDWRKASPGANAPEAPALPAKATSTTEQAAEQLPPIDPGMMAHFIAVQSALTPSEAAVAREVAAELAPGELRAWFEELSALSVPDAVAKIRAFVASTGGKGGVS